jgi:hypothetical protein
VGSFRRAGLLIPALVAVAFVAGGAGAQGWHDYELPIAPGFSIYRMNSFDVCLGTSEGKLLVCPNEYEGVGPLVGYVVTDDSILTEHWGVRPDPLNAAMPDGDSSQRFFFIVSRRTRSVEGPFDRATFASRMPAGDLQWVRPHNPNFWTPLLGDLMILSFFLLVFALPLGVVLLLGFWAWRWWRRHRQDAL